MKDVCRMRGRGVGGCICVRAGANEVSDGGWVEQETLLPPLTAPAWASCPLRHRAGTNYACLNICCTHTHKMKCYVSVLHTFNTFHNI